MSGMWWTCGAAPLLYLAVSSSLRTPLLALPNSMLVLVAPLVWIEWQRRPEATLLIEWLEAAGWIDWMAD